MEGKRVGTFKNEQSGLQASDIPPFVTLNYKMCSLERTLQTMEWTLSNRLNEVPSNVCNSLMEHFNIHGVVPISASQITTMMSDMHRSLILEMQKVLRNNCGSNAT